MILDEDSLPKPTPKEGLHPKKVLINICWDRRNAPYRELLPM